MRSLSNLRSRHATGAPEVRAMLTMPLLAVAADAQIDRDTMSRVLRLCGENPVLLRLGHPVAAQLGKAIMEDMAARGPRVLFLEAVEDLPAPLRETALCFALRVSLDAGRLDPETRAALVMMAEGLGISPARFAVIEDVLQALDRADPIQTPAP